MRPFDQAGDFFEQARVGPQGQALGRRQCARRIGDHGHAFGPVDDHMGGAQAVPVAGEIADCQRGRRQKTMAGGGRRQRQFPIAQIQFTAQRGAVEDRQHRP